MVDIPDFNWKDRTVRFVIALLGITTAIFSGLQTVFAAREEPRKITEGEIKSAINERSDVDQCASLDQTQINHLEYFDFTGDGRPEAVVVASTCMTGTAGPDVHADYARGPEGKLIELPFLDARGDPPYPNGRAPVFGNPNYGLTVEDGELVVRWRDSSDREARSSSGTSGTAGNRRGSNGN